MIKVANNQEETYNSVITIFPELKESEDERIRKELIFYFQEEIPELTTEGYNTCEAVIRNYTYRVCDGDLRNYPHWSHKGDTIKVCGYIHKSHWETGHGTLPLYDGASDNHDLLVSYVMEQLPDTLDYTRKCFIEGILGFNPHYHSGPYNIVPVVVPYKKIVFE